MTSHTADTSESSVRNRTAQIPRKLKDDCIIEALCELQFQSSELPEIVIGRLNDAQQWESFTRTRLPIADIPNPIRAIESSLKFQPTFLLTSQDRSRLVRIGESVLSYHLGGKYRGWENFKPELETTFRSLFDAIKSVMVTRIGLRYINALIPSRHFVGSVHELNLNVEVDASKLSCPMNLNYVTTNDQNTHTTISRVASPMFVQGNLPPETSAVIDIDVFTPGSYQNSKLPEILTWIDAAHDLEKVAFFRLIPPQVIAKLKED